MPSKLYQATYNVLNIDTRGGIVIQKDDSTVIAYDITHVCMDDINALFCNVGGISVNVKAMNVSSGGFMVIVERNNNVCLWKSAEFLFLLLCLVMLVISFAYAQAT